MRACFSSRSARSRSNDIVALEEQEHEEVLRILLALTDAFRRRAEDLDRTIEAAAELDVLQARRGFRRDRRIEPALSTDGRFELQAARHPLMVWAARSGRSTNHGNPGNLALGTPRTLFP